MGDAMNKIDLIIDALQNSEPTGTGWVHVHEQKHQAALAAALELRDSIKEEYNPYEIGKRLQKEGYGISDIGIRVKCDADIDQAIKGYRDQKIKGQA